MPLRLTIENVDRLPDGGPVRVEIDGRGLDLGRDQHLDWTLPDPSRRISSKHCEIRFRDAGYWLHDVSTNGTFVNGAPFRMEAPQLLRHGDRISIGHYIIAVEIDRNPAGSEPGRPEAPSAFEGPVDLWGGEGEIAAPDDRRDYLPAPSRRAAPDFLDFASGLGAPNLSHVGEAPSRAAPAPEAPGPEDDWLRGRPTPAPAAEPVEPIPIPRRRRPSPLPPEPPPAPAAPLAPGAETRVRERGSPDDAPAIPAPPPSAVAAGQPDILLRIIRSAGISERALAGRDPAALAEEIGTVLRLMAGHVAQMLASRSETMSLMRSSNRTMIRAVENNPLKFTASPEEALTIMLGPPTRNYLDAKATIESSFADLKAHQVQTYGAMQAAIEALFEDLAPQKIDDSVEADRGLGAIVGSRKAKLWDVYVERWRAKSRRSDGRLFDAFMALFAESYDRLRRKEPR